MIKKYRTSEIKSLIRKGHKLKIISFQLGIPMEELEQLKKEIEKEKQNKDYQNKLLRIYTIKKKYKNLATKRTEEPKKISKTEINLIYVHIEKLEERLKSMGEDSKEAKRKLISKFAQAIDILTQNTEDIEQLRRLYRKITPEMLHKYQMIINATERRITTKISELQRSDLAAKRNNIPPHILEIAKSILDGTIDVEKANIAIEAEVKRRTENNSQNKFALSFEQEKRQILIQIQKIVEDKLNEMPINNPESMVLHTQQLFGLNIEIAAKTVVTALINRKEFETASSICDNIIRKDRESETATRLRAMKQNIRNAEIGDIILRIINMDMTPEEKITYFERIQNGINTGNINPRMIPLGTTVDGSRKITLADIWGDEKIR